MKMIKLVKSRSMIWTLWAIFFVVVGLASWAGAELADRELPVSDVKLSVVDDSESMPGGRVRVDIGVFYVRSCFVHISRELVDSTGRHFIVANYNADPGPLGIIHSPATFDLDPTFAVGEARYISHPSYACNFMQRWVWLIAAPERVMAFKVHSDTTQGTTLK